MTRRALVCLVALFSMLTGVAAQSAQMQEGAHATASPRPRYDKLSPMLRQMVRGRISGQPARQRPEASPETVSVCSFVKVVPGGESVLQERGCRVLVQEGDICIAMIPMDRLAALSLDDRIVRIEANRSTHALNDVTAQALGVNAAYEGLGLSQAFTGRGVVVGVMDIGFDLTHPTFYSRDTTEYRIRRFWDMLSADTLGTDAASDGLPVGRDYAGRDELLAVAHARDGLEQAHGTHTTGTAAGSGYDSPYKGMAPESDICLVANAVTEDTIFIAPEDYYKYTFALDALGFKYIFDYAESVGKPCVINFSEGSQQDFWGYDQLYYEMLSRLCGPGRIIVSSAGNNGKDKTWFRKPKGTTSEGSFLRSSSHTAMLTLKSAGDFALRLVAYKNGYNDALVIDSRKVVLTEDSLLSAILHIPGDSVCVQAEAYPSCYDEKETCFDVSFSGNHNIGGSTRISFEVMGGEADVEVFRVEGNFVVDSLNPLLTAGECTHSVLSPATAPCVICVGATSYRQSIVNDKGERKVNDHGTDGVRSVTSAVGPTFDGRTKPDVMAPGINVISSYSSYFLENHPDASSVKWNVAHFDFKGRTYAWNSNSGTSMASPAVAGIIALWLEACPTLSPDDVLGIFERTCRRYDETLEYPNNYYGYGEIDAHRGLLDILGADKISGISTSPSKASISFGGDGYIDVQLASASLVPTRISVYSLKGQLIARALMPAGSVSHRLPLPEVRRGDICVVQIDGDDRNSGSVLVRR